MRYTVQYDNEAEVFVSHCPALNIYSQAKTEKEAQLAIKEAVSLRVAIACKCGVSKHE